MSQIQNLQCYDGIIQLPPNLIKNINLEKFSYDCYQKSPDLFCYHILLGLI